MDGSDAGQRTQVIGAIAANNGMVGIKLRHDVQIENVLSENNGGAGIEVGNAVGPTPIPGQSDDGIAPVVILGTTLKNNGDTQIRIERTEETRLRVFNTLATSPSSRALRYRRPAASNGSSFLWNSDLFHATSTESALVEYLVGTTARNCDASKVRKCDPPGDCNNDQNASAGEVFTSVGIALGSTPLTACYLADVSGDSRVTVDEIVGAVAARAPRRRYAQDHAHCRACLRNRRKAPNKFESCLECGTRSTKIDRRPRMHR